MKTYYYNICDRDQNIFYKACSAYDEDFRLFIVEDCAQDYLYRDTVDHPSEFPLTLTIYKEDKTTCLGSFKVNLDIAPSFLAQELSA